MKLIDREPTQEMIEAMQMDQFHLASYVKTLFHAAYDAAPEIQQEPAAIVDANDDGYWADILPDRSVKVGQPLYAFPPDAQAEIAKRDERIVELTDALTDMRGFVSTNTNREMTLKDRFFSAHADFVSDNNFDFDAGLLVSGDFVGEEKNEYARMIACTLNDYAKQAAQIEELAAQNQQLLDGFKRVLGHINLYHLFSCEGGDSYDPECADLNIDKVKAIASEAVASFPDLASPVLNKVKAEALREAAEMFEVIGYSKFKTVPEELRRMADAIEKGEL